MPVIFAINFENTVSPFGWTGINQTAGIVEVATDHPFSGTHNARITLNTGVVAGSFVGFYHTFAGPTPNHDHVFMRAMNVMVDQLPINESGRLPVHGCWVQQSAQLIGNCGFTKIGGVLKFFQSYRNNAVFIMQTGGTPELNTPYSIELEVKQNSAPGVADGAQRMWVDGVLLLEITGIINDDRIISNLLFGLMNTDANPTTVVHFWADDFVASDQYIGPATPPETGASLTVNANPEANVDVYVDDILVGKTPVTVELTAGTHTVRTEQVVIQ